MPSNFWMTSGKSPAATLTIHSCPLPSAVAVRLAEPTYAVWSWVSRPKSHAFAWRRVRRTS